MTPAERWGERLKSTMKARGITCARLASQVGVDRSRIVEWRSGRHLPLMEAAHAVADVLMDPALGTICTDARSKTCAYCGRGFIDNTRGGRGKETCGPTCGSALAGARWREKQKRATVQRRGGWKARYEGAQAAIDTFCRDCEPGGLCHMSACKVRAYSPLPLAKEAVA